MRLSFEEIVRAVDGSAVAGAAPCGIVEGVGTDSRAVKPGSLFVCIPGETFDGHDFAVKAIEAGAAALLVSRNPFDAVPPVPLILVEDTVMEAGISHPNDMDELGAILEPDLALILNVGPGHAAGLGDRGTAHYKSKLLAHLAPGGTAIISADYPDLAREARAVRQELVFFSTSGRQVDYRAAYVVPAGEDKGLFRLWLDGVSIDVEAPFRGAFGAENVIAVAAVAHRLGLGAEEIAAGFAGAALPKQRFACSRAGDWLVIDDSYNANPLSFSRMLEAAAEMAGDHADRPLVCVLGEMGELGSLSEDEHRNLGRLVADIKPRLVCWKGGHLEEFEDGLHAGRYGGAFCPVTSAEDMFKGLAACDLGSGGGVILFKGSRSNKLETLVSAFTEAQAGEPHAV